MIAPVNIDKYELAAKILVSLCVNDDEHTSTQLASRALNCANALVSVCSTDALAPYIKATTNEHSSN